jgi:hypothetical protein
VVSFCGRPTTADEVLGLDFSCLLFGNDLFCFMVKASPTNRPSAMGCNPNHNSIEHPNVV